jgi:nicotinamidase-related amidase
MMGIDTVVIVGAVAEICVACSAQGAWDHGYKVILINDACAGFSEEDHNHTMRNFALYFGKVMDTDELIAVLSKNM